jgi:hypothetical protein
MEFGFLAHPKKTRLPQNGSNPQFGCHIKPSVTRRPIATPESMGRPIGASAGLVA